MIVLLYKIIINYEQGWDFTALAYLFVKKLKNSRVKFVS